MCVLIYSRNSINAINGESAINIPRRGQPIRFLEHVTATVSMNYTDVRGKIEITLVSPSGMTSPLLSLRLYDNVPGGRLSWTFMSVHFWGENPIGQWRLQFRSVYHSATGKINFNEIK